MWRLFRVEQDGDFSGSCRMDGLKMNLGCRSRCVKLKAVELSETEHPTVNQWGKLVFC
jgi:hypothetical protein